MNKFMNNSRQDKEHEYSPNNDTNRENRSIKMANQSPNDNTTNCYTPTPNNNRKNVYKPFYKEVLIIIVFTFLQQIVEPSDWKEQHRQYCLYSSFSFICHDFL